MNLVLDLDGVVYRGETLIPGSDGALRKALEKGSRLWFVTNNSTRTPDEVATKVERLTGVKVSNEAVVTSAQAAASILGPEDTPVLVLGMPAIDRALAELHLATTGDPEEARTVVVGMDRSLTYERLTAAVRAIRSGARFVATNLDPTYPVENGFEPGSGSIVAAVAAASEREPEVAGKPNRPTYDLLKSRGVDGAWVIGDRMDTDIALADNEESWRSVLVLTGATRDGDDHSSANHVVADLSAAIDLVFEEMEGT